MKVKFLKGHVVRGSGGARVAAYCVGDVAEVTQQLGKTLLEMEKAVEVKEAKKPELKKKDV